MKRLALLLLAGCTIGGPVGDPTEEIPVADAGLDAGADAGADAGELDASPAPVLPPPDSTVDSAVDAALVLDAEVADAMPAQSCEPPAPVASCDPVRNTGCPPLTQCDIDTEQSAPTGRCVFAGTTDLTAECTSSGISNSCAPQFTCAQSKCRQLCYCDADCGAGACCSDTAAPGPAGAFKLCQPC